MQDDSNDIRKRTACEEYEKQYLKFKQYIREINQGKRKLTERNLERALESLGEYETYELYEGGLGFVSFAYQMAQDDEVANFVFVTTFYHGLMVQLMEACIKEVDEELTWHLLSLYKKAISMPPDDIHIHRTPEFLINALLGLIQFPTFSYYGKYVSFSDESKRLLIETIYRLTSFLEDDLIIKFAIARIMIVEPNERRLQIYLEFVEEIVTFLYQEKEREEKKKKRMYSFEENRRHWLLPTVIRDFCFINRSDLANQVIESLRDYLPSLSVKLTYYIR